jgi:hypothetical protein
MKENIQVVFEPLLSEEKEDICPKRANAARNGRSVLQSEFENDE